MPMAAKNFNDTAEPKLGQTLLTDLRRKDMKRVITVTDDAEGRLASEVP
jgi:hypothetical protein